MALDISTLTDYSAADLMKAAKHAMAMAAVGGEEYKMPDGRTLKRMSIDEAKQLYNFAANLAAVEAAGENGGGMALVKFGEAR